MEQVALGFFAGGIGAFEMILIAGVALLIFGKRLPEVARSMGRGVVEFKRGLRSVEDEVYHGAEVEDEPARSEPKKLPAGASETVAAEQAPREAAEVTPRTSGSQGSS